MIEIKNISKTFDGEEIIKNFSLNIEENSFVSIIGKNGKGKTTLTNIISLLEDYDEGEIIIDGKSNFTKKEKMLLRRKVLGNIFQNYALVENETVEQNLMIALAYKKNVHEKEIIKFALNKVGLYNLEKRRIFELSGGEQQRVAIARLIVQDCKYVFADEPTGNLDTESRDIVFQLLCDLREMGKTVILVTHDLELAKKTDKIVKIK